ncbi:MAG: MATE family efflux transporter [Myxococcota bacterium]
MTERPATPRELSALLRLAGPFAFLQLANHLLSVVSTGIVGRVGEVAQSAVGLGSSLFFGVAILAMGFVFGFDPLFAQALGAGEQGAARSYARQAGWMVLLAGLPVAAVLVGLSFGLAAFGVDDAVAADTRDYLLARTPGLLPYLLGGAARGYLQAAGITRPLLTAALVANVVNVPLSGLLILGDEALQAAGFAAVGLPALGALGAGLANGVTGALIAWVLLRASAAAGASALPRGRPNIELLRRAARIGAPLALQLFAEVSAFTLATVLAGGFGARALAAHSIALAWASLTFQVAVGLSVAASVRVGLAIGRGDVKGTRQAGFVALGTGATINGGLALVFVLLPGSLARLLSDEAGVVAVATPLLVVAGAFQVVDALQGVAAGALRGAGDTRTTMVANLIGHYAVGLPVGLALAYALGLGVTGLWWGLSAGLGSVALLLTVRFAQLSGRSIERS